MARPPKSSAPFIPARYAALLVDMLLEEGQPPQALLAGTGLGAEPLKEPQRLLSLEQMEHLAANALALSGDPSIGFRLGRRINLSSHGLLGYAGLSSANLDAAIRVAVRYFRLITPLLSLDYRLGRSRASLRITPCFTLSETLERFLVETLIASLHSHAGFLLQERMPATELALRYAEPGHLRAYQSLAPTVTLRFGQPEHCIRFPAELVDTPLPLADEEAAAMALAECDLMLARQPMPGALSQWLRALLMEHRESFPSLERLAERLAISPRTLRRRLSEENTSYRAVLREARMSLAQHYLGQRALAVTEVAQRLGYSDPANFTRAFKRHTGTSPQSYLRSE